MKFPRVAGACFGVALVWVGVGCTRDSGVAATPEPIVLADERGPAPAKPVLPAGWPEAWPAENPYTPEKALLGRKLFFDTRLSSDGGISCAWCHDPDLSFTFKHGGLGSGVHTRPTLRGPSTLLNVAFLPVLMSDGSAASLEAQVLFPLLAENEMDMQVPEVLAVLRGDSAYRRLFRQAFGPEEISIDAMARALATYQRTLVSVSTPYDRWMAGDSAALTPEARAGLALFMGKAKCASCHVPPLFTDGKFHDIGLDALPADSGRMRVTGLPADLGRFRTPTLRNVGWTSPYMHDGRFLFLETVVERYNVGPVAGATADPGVGPLGLSGREVYEITEFLLALSDPLGDP